MTTNPWVAVHPGTSAQERQLRAAHAHERLVMADTDLTRVDPHEVAQLGIRGVVLESWARSRNTRLGGALRAAPELGNRELEAVRDTHPLRDLLPVLNKLLVDAARDAGLLVAVGDATGHLLWVEGEHRLQSEAEKIGFVAGANWSEAAVGTSAPGTALELGRGIQITGAEHFDPLVHHWSCTAVPVHDPLTHTLIGYIDITGGDEAVAPQSLPLIEATVAVIEAELRLRALRETSERATQTTSAPAKLTVTGTLAPPVATENAHPGRETPAGVLRVMTPGPYTLTRSDAAPRSGDEPLTLRHAELVTLLSWHPAGLSSRVLAELLYGSPRAEGTLRAEIVRLRQALRSSGSSVELLSRPYRLSIPVDLDAARVRELLLRGSHRQALSLALTPVLPDSQSPGVEAIRAELALALSETMLSDASLETLTDFAQSAHGAEDPEVWWALLQRLPLKSPKRALVVARLEQLNRPDASR